MSTTELAISSFVIALSGAMMPGPLLTYVINGSLKKGFIAGPMVITGHSLLELLLVILLLSGLSNLFASELFTSTVGIIGGLALVLLALDMSRAAVKKEVSVENEINEKTNVKEKVSGLILPGALVSLANPYWIIWWATIGITYLANARQQGTAATGIFFLGHISADYVWYAAVAFVISRGRRFLNDSLYRGLIIFFSLVLIYFGITFFYDGINFFI